VGIDRIHGGSGKSQTVVLSRDYKEAIEYGNGNEETGLQYDGT